jgi:pseudouridine-5'-phosphate glycosidase
MVPLLLTEEVRAALADRRPVVALESTLVAHGLPWPDNLEVGSALEQEVRRGGGVPATVAIVDGAIRVGLDAATLERIARGGSEQQWRKAGVADLAPLLACKQNGATTVSATSYAAARAGIRVFATGGIGGVHRGDSADVSSDLTSLAREPIAVVSAGAKAVLDLPRTLEMLETLGVLVLGVRTSELPAFYTPSSGLPLEHRVENADEAARVCHLHWSLGLKGVLLANPIAAEHALEPALVYDAVEDALSNAQRIGVRGKELTPYLLRHLARVTDKRSLTANRALALANARFAVEVAGALSALPPLG